MGHGIEVEHDNDVVRLTVHGRGDTNKIDRTTLAQLRDAVETLTEDAKLVTIRGSGGLFSVGASNDELYQAVQAGDRAAVREFMQEFHRATADLESLPVPTLAVIEGYAYAGGFELQLACDLRIATTEAKLSDHHATYGFVPGGGSTQRLPRQIATPRAKELLYTGRVLTGAEAEDWGLVNKAVEPESLDGALSTFEETLTATSRTAGAATKELVEHSFETGKSIGLAFERTTVVDHFFSDDAKAGFAALEDGDRPSF